MPTARVSGVPVDRGRGVLFRDTTLAAAAGFERGDVEVCRTPGDRKLDRLERRSRRMRAVSIAGEGALAEV